MLLERLAKFDQAVAAQAAYLWQKRGNSLSDPRHNHKVAERIARCSSWYYYIFGSLARERARIVSKLASDGTIRIVSRSDSQVWWPNEA